MNIDQDRYLYSKSQIENWLYGFLFDPLKKKCNPLILDFFFKLFFEREVLRSYRPESEERRKKQDKRKPAVLRTNLIRSG
jgi:hypothetical protein